MENGTIMLVIIEAPTVPFWLLGIAGQAKRRRSAVQKCFVDGETLEVDV